jgi:hypothetical protein
MYWSIHAGPAATELLPHRRAIEPLPNLRSQAAELTRLGDDEPTSDQSSAAWKAIIFIWPRGVPSNEKTALIHREVNKWIKKQPRNIISVESVSRETVLCVLGRRK